jgi:DNA-binding Lrp family transcriptional regulator
MTRIKLDRVDLKLLDALQASGRISNQDLAAKVGLSPSACHSRVRRLEATRVLRGFYADVSLRDLGPHLEVCAEVTLSNHTPADFKRFEVAIARVPYVVRAYQVSGAFDYFLHLVCRDMQHYREINDALTAGRYGVEKVASHIVMANAKPFAGVPVSELLGLSAK